jgi:hypothetical protein
MTEIELNELKRRIDKAEGLKREIGALESDLARLRCSAEAIAGGCTSLNALTQDITNLTNRLNGLLGGDLVAMLKKHIESQIPPLQEMLAKI